MRAPEAASKRCVACGSIETRISSPGCARDPLAEDADDLGRAEPCRGRGSPSRSARRRRPCSGTSPPRCIDFGPQAVDHRAGRRGGERPADRQRHAVAGDEAAAVGAVDPAGQHVHRRRADEARDEEVRRHVVEVERRADLLDAAVVHDDDLVGHGHRLDLVVGDVDRRRLQPLVQVLDLGAHRDAQLGVEVRERLVEEEDLRVAHDRPAHGDALALAAGELARVAVEQRRSGRGSRRRAARGRRSRPWARSSASARRPCCRRRSGAGRARSSGTPSRCPAPWAAGRSPPGRRSRSRPEVTCSRPGQHPQQRRLAAARGTDEHDELAFLRCRSRRRAGSRRCRRTCAGCESSPPPCGALPPVVVCRATVAAHPALRNRRTRRIRADARDC